MDCNLPERCQDPEDRLDYEFDFAWQIAKRWAADRDFAAAERIRPDRSTGYEYEATTGGHTGSREPRWPKTLGATVVDGSVTWTCRALSSASLSTSISGAPTWTADDGITVSDATLSGTIARAFLSGGEDGQRYLVRCEAVMADTTEKNQSMWLKISRREQVA